MQPDDLNAMREYGEQEAKRQMGNLGVDDSRILEVATAIRTIMDSGSANEIGFLQVMLEASLTMIPYAWEIARDKEKHK